MTNSQLPLNQSLYDRLCKRSGSVLIAGQGVSLDGYVVNLSGDKPKFHVVQPGEYYRICCPFCLRRNAVDTRHRLWINHRWGVGPDGLPGERLWFMAICYNENCMDDPENRKALRTMVYGGIGREFHPPKVHIRRGITNSALTTVGFPGHCVRVDQLPPDHHASQFLMGRGFAPAHLGQAYGISYCQEDPDCHMANGRLIVPIYMRGKMVSWQGRYVGDLDWKSTGTPKYFNCPGTNTRLSLYGFDAAQALPFCIVVEGVTDVWAVGDGAVALLGKSMSQQQFDLIRRCWKAAVVVLDDDALQASVDMHRRLAQVMPVARVVLPRGLDPGSLDSNTLWDLILRATSEAGIDLSNLATPSRITQEAQTTNHQ